MTEGGGGGRPRHMGAARGRGDVHGGGGEGRLRHTGMAAKGGRGTRGSAKRGIRILGF